jgi:hypothetical protein
MFHVRTGRVNYISLGWLVGLAALVLAPFLAKPLHMDAPLMVWAARQIRQDPFHFYSVAVNWFGTVEGLDRILRMPPLFAAVLSPLAYHEALLSFIPLAFALTAVAGIFVLARLWGADPLWSCLAAIATPAFVVCGSLVMPDMALLSFWVWALVFQVKGHERPAWWAAATLFATAAVLTKYSGLTLLPLMALYSFAKDRRFSIGLLSLVFPLIAFAVYQQYTGSLYGEGLFSESARYAFGYQPHTLGWALRKSLTALSFAGGGFAVGVFFFPFLWPAKQRTSWLIGAAVVAVLALTTGPFESFSFNARTGVRWAILIQFVVWTMGGIQWAALAISEWRRRRDPASLVAVAWLGGTLAFAAYFNWSVTVRSLLPALPAIAIVLSWRMQSVGVPFRQRTGAIAVSSILALAAGWADARLAFAAMDTARQTVSLKETAENIWFQGHWGFQYYLEKIGAKAVDYERSVISPADRLLIPLNNIRVQFPPRDSVDLLGTLSVPGPWGLTVHHGELGAGFHSDYWGPLPLAFGPVPPEKTLLWRPRSTLKYPS